METANAHNVVIRSIRRYQGSPHRRAICKLVVIVAVSRQGAASMLRDDAQIGELRPDDTVEFSTIVPDPDGGHRTSCVTSHASPDELGPVEGVYQGRIANGLLTDSPSAD